MKETGQTGETTVAQVRATVEGQQVQIPVQVVQTTQQPESLSNANESEKVQATS